ARRQPTSPSHRSATGPSLSPLKGGKGFSGRLLMRFGLFGSAQARRPDPLAPDTDSSQGFRDWIENNVEAEALGFHSTFVVEHHFTGFGQVSASLNLLT